MARLPRSVLAEGRFFHLYALGVNHLAIFRDNQDRRDFLRLLATATDRVGWDCHAFCLMDTHVHLVVEAPLACVSRGMQLLLGRYAQRFNKRHNRCGHLFGSRFGARVIQDERQLETAVLYVLYNPVRAGMVEAAWDWPWSDARVLRRAEAILAAH